MTRLDVRLLGDFQVAVDSRAVPADAWPQRRAADLVKLLALAPRHRLPRDQVFEALWPQLAPEAAAANLHKAAHYARRAIGDRRAVVLGGGQVALLPDGEVGTDVERLEAGDPDAYGGELLPDDRYDAWTLAHRDRVQGLLADALRRAGRWDDLTAADPTDEDACRALMREAADAGDRVAAVRHFRRLRDELAGLGLQPSEETLALLADISRGPAVHAPVLHHDAPIGREAELAVGRTAIDAAGAGRGEAVWIEGPAGIGKTRLAEALLSDARARDWHSLRGAAHDDTAGAPYRPVAAALEPLLDERPDLAAHLPTAAQRTLAALTGSGRRGPSPSPPEGERHRIFTAVRHLVSAAARERPLLLLIEDLHAADSATIELTQHLARVTRRHGVLVVLTSRDEMPRPVRAARDALIRERVARVVAVGPLDISAATALAERSAGRPLPGEVARAIARSAAGNPLFVEELAGATGPDGALSLPRSIEDVLAPTLDRAERAGGDVLRWVAVADDGFTAGELAALAELDEADVEAALARLEESGMLQRSPQGLRFRHPLLRETLRRRIAPGALADAHMAAARELRAGEAAPERVAHHLLRGGRPGEAVPLLAAAAEWAVSVAAFGDAQRWLEEALEHAEPGARPELLALLAGVRARTGDPRAAGTYDAAVAAADGRELPRLRLDQARAQLGGGDVEGARRTLARVVPRDVAERGRLSLYHGFVAWYEGDFAAAGERADAAEPLLEEAGLRAELMKLHELKAMLAHAGGQWTDHTHWQLGEVWTLPEVAGVVFDAYLCVTEFALTAGAPYESLARFATQLRAHARQAGARRGEAYATTVLGEAALLSGDLRTAGEKLSEAARLSREVGALGGESLARVRLAETLLHQGDRAGARAQVDEALDLCDASSLGEHLLYIAHSMAVRIPADPAEGAALVRRGEEVLDRTSPCDFCPVGWWATASAVAARGGDVAMSRSLLDRAERAAHLRAAAVWRGAIAEARAELAIARDDADGAAELRRAADTYAAAGHVLNERRVRERLAAVTIRV